MWLPRQLSTVNFYNIDIVVSRGCIASSLHDKEVVSECGMKITYTYTAYTVPNLPGHLHAARETREVRLSSVVI